MFTRAKARRMVNIARSSALQHLVRKGQTRASAHTDKGHTRRDTGHQQMTDETQECIGRIGTMVLADRIGRSSDARRVRHTRHPVPAATRARAQRARSSRQIILLFLAPILAANKMTSNVRRGLRVPSVRHHLYSNTHTHTHTHTTDTDTDTHTHSLSLSKRDTACLCH